MKRTIIITIAAISAATLAGGCKSTKHEKVDLSGIHTTAATTAAPETLAPSWPESEEAPAATDEDTSTIKGITAKVETYQTENISIQYPKISGMTDKIRQDQVNQLLKDNARAYLKTGVNELKDSLNILCKVISVDRKRVTATYKGVYTKSGTTSPRNVFYTSTVDLEQGKNLGLNDFADAYTMAGYVMSEDCEFYSVSPEVNRSLLSYRADQKTIDDYTKLFNSADFSTMKSGEDAVFPDSFSYTDLGVLYFSIPVSPALGDYAIIKFDLDGK